MTQPEQRLPFSRPRAFQLPPELQDVQDSGPACPVLTADGNPAWLVTRYAEVRSLIADKRLRPAQADIPLGTYHDQYVADLVGWRERRALFRPLFSAQRIREFTPVVTRLAKEQVGAVASSPPPTDMHSALSVDYPLSVLYAFLGLPDDGRRTELLQVMRNICDPADAALKRTAAATLRRHVRDLAGTAEAAATPGAIRQLMNTCDADTTASLVVTLILGSTTTTTLCIDLGALLLLGDQVQWHMLTRQPELIAAAVEEALRMTFFGGGGVRRFAREEINVDGVHIDVGDEVLLDFGAANYDPLTFPNPHRFDIRRANGSQLSFGHADRYCTGASLARLELRALFGEMARQIPGARLTKPLEDISFRNGSPMAGLTHLPVSWDYQEG